MNGAVIGCIDQVQRLPEDNFNLQSGIGKCHLLQQNSQRLESKIMSYQSSHSFCIDNSSILPNSREHFLSEQGGNSSDSSDPRHEFRTVMKRKAIDLPVPQFIVDDNYVGKRPRSFSVQDSKELDLDTRIKLLIQSNALPGINPVFSELDEPEEFKEKHRRVAEERFSIESDDDPDKPLSRPPSPFLSRATYLFWFNKAIEIREQAKEQEKALLEIASKKLQNNNKATPTKPEIKMVTKPDVSSNKKRALKSLLEEVSKELKEVVKQEFLREVVEEAALSALENWFQENKDMKYDSSISRGHSKEDSEKSLLCIKEETGSESPPSVTSIVYDKKTNIGQTSQDLILTENYESTKESVRNSSEEIKSKYNVREEELLSEENDRTFNLDSSKVQINCQIPNKSVCDNVEQAKSESENKSEGSTNSERKINNTNQISNPTDSIKTS